MNVGKIFLELNSKELHQSSGKGKESCFLVFVQRRQRNAQKSVMHVQSCCFANLNLSLFCRSRGRQRRRRRVNSLVT